MPSPKSLAAVVAIESAAAFNRPDAAEPPRHTDTAVPASPAPTVEILSWDQTQKRREQLHGKVVVLDVWSTYCDPCIREFPNLVKLQARFGDKSPASRSTPTMPAPRTNRRSRFAERVQDFLDVSEGPPVERPVERSERRVLHKIRLGGPPAVFVYDREGKLVKRFDNSQVPKTPEFNYKNDVVPLVERLCRLSRNPAAMTR